MENKKSLPVRQLLLDTASDFLGCAILSIGLICFNAPNNIASGGVSGLAIILNYLTDVPISLITLAFNVPLLIMAWIFLGHKFTLKTMKSVLILTFMLEVVSWPGLHYTGNPILAALYGGVLEGIGLALVFMRSSTTGGTDVASRLLQLKFPHMSIGKLILAVDGCVLVVAAIAYNNIENALYALIAIFAATTVIDNLLYGLDMGKMMMIMTLHPDDISNAIIGDLDRTCTILNAQGSYSKREQPVILCVVRRQQYFELKRIVHKVDPNAFVIAVEASEIIGEGFKDIADSTKIQ